MLDNLSGPMLELALEEVRNMQFEMEMLSRSMQRNVNSELIGNVELHEPAMQSW